MKRKQNMSLELPWDFYQEVKEWAKREERSINKSVIYALKRAMEQSEKQREREAVEA